jgi:hypothetical protein
LKIFPWCAAAPAEHQLSCSGSSGREKPDTQGWKIPISFVEDHNFVSAFRQRHLFLRESFDFIPYNVDATDDRSVGE